MSPYFIIEETVVKSVQDAALTAQRLGGFFNGHLVPHFYTARRFAPIGGRLLALEGDGHNSLARP